MIHTLHRRWSLWAGVTKMNCQQNWRRAEKWADIVGHWKGQTSHFEQVPNGHAKAMVHIVNGTTRTVIAIWQKQTLLISIPSAPIACAKSSAGADMLPMCHRNCAVQQCNAVAKQTKRPPHWIPWSLTWFLLHCMDIISAGYLQTFATAHYTTKINYL